jgi:hypothetical protein
MSARWRGGGGGGGRGGGVHAVACWREVGVDGEALEQSGRDVSEQEQELKPVLNAYAAQRDG